MEKRIIMSIIYVYYTVFRLNGVNNGMKTFMEYAEDVIGFFREKGIDFGEKVPSVSFDGEKVSRFDVFAPTGHYDWTQDEIVLRIDGRHAKDVMRTLCHELIHAWQFRRDPEGYTGFDKTGDLEENPALAEYEREAYELGNMYFRMWTEKAKKTS